MQLSKNVPNHVRFILNVQKFAQKCVMTAPYTTSVDALDLFTSELLHRHQKRKRISPFTSKDFIPNIRFFTEVENNDISQMSSEQLDTTIQELLSNNKDKQIQQIVEDCLNYRKFLPIGTLKKLFRNYSILGKPEYIIILQNYSAKVDPILNKRNGEFLHYLAKAQCMKGNSDKGLSILQDAYTKYIGLRSLYRVIFKELIQDSVLNRSEATLVIFKKYVLHFNDKFEDPYPLVCFWHICWSSSWFSDQVLSEELLEASEGLQEIVKDK